MPTKQEKPLSSTMDEAGRVDALGKELQSQFAAVDVQLLKEFMDAAEQKGHDLNAAMEAAMLTYILPVRIHKRVDSVFDGIKHALVSVFRFVRHLGGKMRRKSVR